MLRTFREQPGFLRYGVADVGDKTLVSISVWETRKHADAAVPVATTWVRENLGDQIEIRSTRSVTSPSTKVRRRPSNAIHGRELTSVSSLFHALVSCQRHERWPAPASAPIWPPTFEPRRAATESRSCS